MPPVSILDLVPQPPTTNVKIGTTEGIQELELSGIPLRTLADIAKRFPKFARLLDWGTGSLLDDPAAFAALAAASLGHANNAEWETRIAGLPLRECIAIANGIMALTWPADTSPLSLNFKPNGAGTDAGGTDPISLSPSSS